MSNLIPPLLSSSPPPIVGPLDEEDEDEFGDFRAAGNSFDCDELSLPPSPQKSPEKELKNDCPKLSLDINCNKSQKVTEEMPTENLNGSIFNQEVDKDFQDRRKSEDDSKQSEIEVNSSSSRPASPPIESNHTDFCLSDDKVEASIASDQINQLESCNDLSEEDFADLQSVLPSDTSKRESEIIEDNESPIDCSNEENLFEAFSEEKTNSDEISELNEINDIKIEEDDAIEIDISERDLEKEISNNLSESSKSSEDDEFGDFEKHFNNDEKPSEDDFDDFVDPVPPSVESAEDEDFGDFETSQDKPTLLEIDEKNAADKSGTILKEIFPEIVADLNEFESYDETKGNSIFDELKDVTETNALIYQWSKSNSQKMFFKALNIDTRNILYGPSWNSSMPRFAANLGLTPLEPVRTEILTPTPFQNNSSPSISSQKNTSDIPTAQFDWSGSGLINPLDSKSTEPPGTTVPEDSSQPKVQNNFLPTATTITVEKQEAIPSLFDVDILEKLTTQTTTSTTNSQSDDFTQFESPKIVPLRETHIFNDPIDSKPGWLQPTILTPDLPRKEPVVDTQEDDEFDDFQMVLPEEKVAPSVTESKSLTLSDLGEFETTVHNQEHIFGEKSEAVVQDEDEFTEFHSSVPPTAILKPLQPVPLEPLKPTIQYTTVAQINWPDPGVTDEDIRNIELAFSHKSEEKPKELSKKSSLDDDEWTDFVSVKSQLPERTATPDLPLSVLNLNKVEAPKQPIPVITPSGLVQTKLSSNLTLQPKSVVQTSVQPNLFKPQPTMFQPSIISNQYAANFLPKDDDDDWSDFVSSQPPPVNGYQPKNPAKTPQVNWTNATTNIIMNPTHFESFQSYAPAQSKKVTALPARNPISSISSIPDLDFIAPKNRTSKK